MSSAGRLLASDLIQESEDRRRERVVAIARDHMSRARHVDNASVGDKRDEFLRSFSAQQVAAGTTDEQGRQGELARGRLQECGVLTARTALRVEESRIPMPTKSPVGSDAEVMLQAGRVGRPWALGDVRCDRVRGGGPRIPG